MNKKITNLSTVIVLSFITLLTGCNSEGAFNGSENQPTSPPDAAIFDIVVTPSDGFVLQRLQTLQLKATAKYDDGTEADVSDSVEWEIIGGSASATAEVSLTGQVTAEAVGEIVLTASKNNIVSEDITVTVTTLAGPVIDVFDADGKGKLFTSPPSKAFYDSIGGDPNKTNGSYTENGGYGPTGEFYRFIHTNAKELCKTYNTKSIGGRKNWRLPEKDELEVELYDDHGAHNGGMFGARGWPTTFAYWSVTFEDSRYYVVYLYDGLVDRNDASHTNYVSCVSNP